MNKDLTEAEIMGNGPAGQVFVAYGPDNSEHTFGTIGAWQAFMDDLIRHFFESPKHVRMLFDLNEDVLNGLGQQPQFAKAVGVIRAQFSRALGEG